MLLLFAVISRFAGLHHRSARTTIQLRRNAKVLALRKRLRKSGGPRETKISGILMKKLGRDPKKRPSKRLRQHGGGHDGHAPRHLLRRRSAVGGESAWWLGLALSRCGIFSTARPPASPLLCVWTDWAWIAGPPTPYRLPELKHQKSECGALRLQASS